MGETRIELKHLLEDLRDTYPHPEEEVVVSELVANALDSGATRLAFDADVEAGTLTLVDDGRGMTARQLKSYHDIAATGKARGTGIGFAGVGAKIALLGAEHVVTETRRGAYHRATRWTLESPRRAPWTYVPPAGLVGPP
ncbi:MAG: ATP-binding protein, partial [bacterium]